MFTRCVFHESTPCSRRPLFEAHYPAACSTTEVVADVVRGAKVVNDRKAHIVKIPYEERFDTYPPPPNPETSVDWSQQFTPEHPCPPVSERLAPLPAQAGRKSFSSSRKNQLLVDRLRNRNVKRVYSLLDPDDLGYIDVHESLYHIREAHKEDSEMGELLLEVLEGSSKLVSSRGVIEKRAFCNFLRNEIDRSLGMTSRVALLRTQLTGHCNGALFAVNSELQRRCQIKLDRCTRGMRQMGQYPRVEPAVTTGKHTNPVARAFVHKSKTVNVLERPMYRAVYKPGKPLGFKEHEAVCVLCSDDEASDEETRQEAPFACLGGDFLRGRLVQERVKEPWGPVDASLEVHAAITERRRKEKIARLKAEQEADVQRSRIPPKRADLHNCICTCPMDSIDRLRHFDTCTAAFHPCKPTKPVCTLASKMTRRMPDPNRIYPTTDKSTVPLPMEKLQIAKARTIEAFWNQPQTKTQPPPVQDPGLFPDLDWSGSFVMHSLADPQPHTHWPASLRSECDKDCIYRVPEE
ncbi:MAG: hypothetical protein KVP17_002065 [Porospora cf. gigantea B]|uniref:uncharacterized protein n=1 Tax=Porospora cf. gigantea B TaxID=2853592 RepID=UPI003571F340|nr:MAG: hypothetical protein KVP17_002065 [Porospora cf. gigantea B]